MQCVLAVVVCVGVRMQLPQCFVGQDVYRTAVGLRAGGLSYYQWELQAFIWVTQGLCWTWGCKFILNFGYGPGCRVLNAEYRLQGHAVQCAVQLQVFLQM